MHLQAMLTVSIVIPTLNESFGIAQAVRRAWDTQPHEVIVVDGGSSDGTIELAAGQGARTLRAAQGRAVQQNVGARMASGEAIVFLHADNWLDRTGVRQIAEALAEPTILAGAFYQRIDASGMVYRWLERGNALRARWRCLPYGDQGLFFRRDVFEQLGGFPEVRLMEDLLLMRRFRKLGRPVLLPGPLHVSARRWSKYGIVGQTLRNGSLLVAERLGVPPDRLARFYAPHERP